MKNILFVSVALLFLIGCHDPTFIKKKIAICLSKKCIGSDTCVTTFSMHEITDFKWDKAYICNEGISRERMEEAIGTYYPYTVDVSIHIIFLYNNQIVYHDDEYPNPERPSTRGIFFNFDDVVLTPGNDSFSVKKELSDYTLTPIKREQ